MPRVAEMRQIDGALWCRVEADTDQGAITLWTDEDIKDFRRACVRDFLIDLFNQWKDRL